MGVSSLTPIKEDTLICEYIGNIMTEKEIKSLGQENPLTKMEKK